MTPAIRAGTVPRATARGIVVLALTLPIRAYQLLVSPLLAPRCRFYPSCSSYALGTIRVHGPLRGTWLAGRRLLRCHPWNAGGLDPVPPPTRVGSPETSPGSDPNRRAPQGAGT